MERGKVVIREREVESSRQRRAIVSRPRRHRHRAQKNHESVCSATSECGLRLLAEVIGHDSTRTDSLDVY